MTPVMSPSLSVATHQPHAASSSATRSFGLRGLKVQSPPVGSPLRDVQSVAQWNVPLTPFHSPEAVNSPASPAGTSCVTRVPPGAKTEAVASSLSRSPPTVSSAIR